MNSWVIVSTLVNMGAVLWSHFTRTQMRLRHNHVTSSVLPVCILVGCLRLSATAGQVSEQYSFTTFAGHVGEFGSTDGIGADARFAYPRGVAVDITGAVYVADWGNSVIRKITPDGVVSTLAGQPGSTGSADGTSSDARFNEPSGVSVDAAGVVYVADDKNNAIRKIRAAGVVSTWVGSGWSPVGVDGIGLDARFVDPVGVAVDSAGNVYVADYNDDAIRKITSNAVVSTLAGNWGKNGVPTGVNFLHPRGVAVDNNGTIYVADTDNSTIRKITPTGVVSTFAGSAGVKGNADGIGSQALFSRPFGLAVDSTGNIYVADTGNNTIRKITPGGEASTLAGVPGVAGSADGVGGDARFSAPNGLAVDGSGNIYVADTGNHRISKGTRVLAPVALPRISRVEKVANSGLILTIATTETTTNRLAVETTEVIAGLVQWSTDTNAVVITNAVGEFQTWLKPSKPTQFYRVRVGP